MVGDDNTINEKGNENELGIDRQQSAAKELAEQCSSTSSPEIDAVLLDENTSTDISNESNTFAKNNTTGDEGREETKSNESFMKQESNKEEEKSPDESHDKVSERKKILKKAGVAVAGGALITAGIPLIPVLCAGELMIIGGMALLATEFDSAKNALYKGRDTLANFADKEEDSDTENVNADEKSKSNLNGRMIERDNTGNSEINPSVKERAVKITKNVQRSMRKMVKKDVLPLLDKYVVPKSDDTKNTKCS